MKNSVGIIDCGINNINSLQKAFNKIEVNTEVVRSYKNLQDFSHIVLPGVGSFDKGMENLKNMGFIEEIHKLAEKGNFILGICLGMQLLFEESKESLNNYSGLSLAKGKCEKLKIIKDSKIRVPHMGWNSLKIKKKDVKLLANIEDNSDFYFVHSYYVVPESSNNIAATCNHGVEFTAVYESNNIFGVQFHPEKCLKNGLNILKQFSQFS